MGKTSEKPRWVAPAGIGVCWGQSRPWGVDLELLQYIAHGNDLTKVDGRTGVRYVWSILAALRRVRDARGATLLLGCAVKHM